MLFDFNKSFSFTLFCKHFFSGKRNVLKNKKSINFENCNLNSFKVAFNRFF